MSETTDRRGVIAGVLAEHESLLGSDDYSRCLCGLVTVSLGGLRAHVAEQIDRALGQGEGEREGTTVTEWRIGNPDGPSFAIDPAAPEAEYWTRKVAAQRDSSWVERRQRTTYPDRVTDWEVVTDE